MTYWAESMTKTLESMTKTLESMTKPRESMTARWQDLDFYIELWRNSKPEVGLNETFCQRIDDKNINYVLYRYMVGDFHFFQNVRNLVLEKKYVFMKMGKPPKKIVGFYIFKKIFFLKRVFFQNFKYPKNKF